MTEAGLQRGLLRTLRQTFTSWSIFKHSDMIASGVPDISVTGRRMTIWLEVKFANPVVKLRGQQEYEIQRLARNGNAYYVVYCLQKDGKWRTEIKHSSQLHTTDNVMQAEGVNHALVVSFLKRITTYDDDGT